MKRFLFAAAILVCGIVGVFAQDNTPSSSTAYEASRVVKASPGTLYSLSGYNSKGSAQFIQLFDSATVPGNAAAEVSTVTTTGKTAVGLADKYFIIYDNAGSVYVWFNLDAGGVDPAPAGITRGIAVPIATGDAVDVIAAAIGTAVEADSKFAATAASNVATITDSNVGSRTDIAAGNSTLAVAVTTQGINATPIAVITAAASSNFDFRGLIPNGGLPFAAGIAVSNSSTGPTKTIGSADCYFAAVYR